LESIATPPTSSGNRVLLDSDAIIQYPNLIKTGKLPASDIPVITRVSIAELRNKIAREGSLRGLPKYID
jgi:hypothetical protein